MAEVSSSSSKKNSNQFGLGLVLGFLTGLTSYFLFTTKEGRELRENLKLRWQEVKEELPDVKQLKLGDLDFEEFVNVILGIKLPKALESGLKIKDASRTGTRSHQSQPKKFKGV